MTSALKDLNDGVKEIFKYKELLKSIITASLNTPNIYLQKIAAIHQDFYEMVLSFQEYTLTDVYSFMNKVLPKYDSQPFFPVLAGLYINALITRLFDSLDQIDLDMDTFCTTVVNDATNAASPVTEEEGDSGEEAEVSFSLDFLGYLLPANKILNIKGHVGDYCGAAMQKGSTLSLNGMHGKHFGFGRDAESNLTTDISLA